MSDYTPPPVPPAPPVPEWTPPPAPPYQPAPPAPPMAPPSAGGAGPASDTSKLLSGLAYLPGVGWIAAVILLVMDPYKDEPFCKFNAVQGLSLLVLSLLVVIPIIGWIWWVLVVVFMIIAAINAFQGKHYEVPVIGGLVKGWFNV